ncbi:MAG: bifunctional UDP-N-acetylglucosamine diphosphorylase/glucosamine-1-phosphate N-acetyltransferase GlmU [Betaproteobacteria bacterium]
MTTSPSAKPNGSPTLNVVILAAGQGKRMKSALPKVLHPIAGKSMLGHVISSATQLAPDNVCVVYGHGGDQVRAAFSGENLLWAKQEPQLGTGHAVLQAIPHLSTNGVTLIVYGDVPLINASTLSRLVESARESKLAWLTEVVENPAGLGRIMRDAKGKVQGIVEDKDATAAQREIREINTGFLACPTALLAKWLPTLGNKNAQGEYYLTDILAIAVAEGIAVQTHHPAHSWEVVGVNSRDQLAQLERTYQRQIAQHLMEDGVSLADPMRIDVRGKLTCGADVAIDVNCIFEGNVHLATGVKVGANCILRSCTVGTNSEILPFSDIDSAVIGASARIGPFARIRPGTVLADEVHLGNFVEVKASEFGTGSKANHLTYIGDTTVGSKVNIGAGTIVCNYDGANKHRSVIEDGVHIGSDVQLVAPITIGTGADIAAGTTVWRDVPPGGLTFNGKTQLSKPEWKRPQKKK